METEDEINNFSEVDRDGMLVHNKMFQTGSMQPPPVQQQAEQNVKNQKKRVKCPKPQRVKSKSNLKGLSTGQKDWRSCYWRWFNCNWNSNCTSRWSCTWSC